MDVKLTLKFGRNLRRALRHRWGDEGLATRKEIADWLKEMLERTSESILEGAYKDGVIDEPADTK